MSNIVFQDPAPFHLPAAHRAKADVVANTVQITLYALIAGHEDLQPIRCQMPSHVARELGAQLTGAADQLDLQDE